MKPPAIVASLFLSADPDDRRLAESAVSFAVRPFRRKFRCLRAATAFFFIALFASFAAFLAGSK